jgi:hypothetical protein
MTVLDGAAEMNRVRFAAQSITCNEVRGAYKRAMKTLAIFKYTFTGVGAAMLIGALVWAFHTRSFIAHAAPAQGTVIDLVESRSNDGSSTWRPVVRFAAADGQQRQFTSRFSSNPPAYRRGEPVTVLYDVGDPQDAAINGFLALWLGPIIVGGIGLVLFAAGGSVMLVPWLGRRRAAELRATGTPIQTTLQGVERNRSVAIEGTNPWRIATQWQDPASGEVRVFRSDNIWYDPAPYLKRDAITVYIAPGNPKRYWVDVSFLPKLAA